MDKFQYEIYMNLLDTCSQQEAKKIIDDNWHNKSGYFFNVVSKACYLFELPDYYRALEMGLKQHVRSYVDNINLTYGQTLLYPEIIKAFKEGKEIQFKLNSVQKWSTATVNDILYIQNSRNVQTRILCK